MENVENSKVLEPASTKSLISAEPSTSTVLASTPSKYLPKGKVINLIPKLIGSPQSSRTSSSFAKAREPRFVPFEPYKAAVTPLFTLDGNKRKAGGGQKKRRNTTNVDLNLLADQLAENTRVEMLNIPGLTLGAGNGETPGNKWELMYNDMRKEKEYFEKQLSFQTQVNADLKNLLIAAVGEDIQTRVNVLTEDKLSLARSLLDSSNHLSAHSEQIEYLAGQCEVWRSKFLASSLMVEELARWKTTLLEKNKHLVASNQELLKTMAQLRDLQTETLKNLSFLVRDKSQVHLQSANAIDLARESLNISEQLALINHSIGVPSDLRLENLEHLTLAEKTALDALEITKRNLIRTDDPFKAIVNHAFPMLAPKREERINLGLGLSDIEGSANDPHQMVDEHEA